MPVMTSKGRQRSLQGTGSPIDSSSRENLCFTIGVASPCMVLLNLHYGVLGKMWMTKLSQPICIAGVKTHQKTGGLHLIC